MILDTLAAAYAEAGNYAQAVRTAAKAKTLAEQAGNAALAAQIGNRLQFYVEQKPFRESPRESGSVPGQ